MGEVVTVWLNSSPDPQRGTRLPASFDPIRPLADSVASHGHRLVVLTDCLPTVSEPALTAIQTSGGGNPYFRRWQAIASYLAAFETETETEAVWCVDAGDVEMLADPFPHTDERLHIGSESDVVGSSWMRATNPSQSAWIGANHKRPLLNPGVVGGPRRTVEAFARAVGQFAGPNDMTDMAAANRAAYMIWPSHRTGTPVHTVYKAEERSGGWWKHK